MKLLTKYILKEFAKPFFFGLLLFCIIFFISELFYRLHDFITHKASSDIIIWYLFLHTPLWLVQSIPVAVLLATFFSLSKFSCTGEYIAIKSAGISHYCIILPLLITGFVISILSIMINEYATPQCYSLAKKIFNQKIKKEKICTEWHDIVFTTRQGYRISIGKFIYTEKTMFNVLIEKLDKDYLIKRQFKAKKMLWKDNKWYLVEVLEREFAAGDLLTERRLREKEITLEILPEDIIPMKKDAIELTSAELKKRISTFQYIGKPVQKELVELYCKLSYPLTTFTVLFFCIPFALSTKYGRIRSLVYSLLVSLGYWILISTSKAIGEAGLINPLLSAWSANLLFLLVGIILLFRMQY